MANPHQDRTQKLQPRSMDDQINIFNTQAAQDPDFIYQSYSPAGNQYDVRDFSTVSQRSQKGLRQRQVNDGPIDFKSHRISNSYFTNPDTGQKFGKSTAQGPEGWFETRRIHPDASGIGQLYDKEGNYSQYPIQLKGPQTWDYDPAIEEQGSRLDIYDSKDDDDITMESIMKDMKEDAILYPEGSTPGGLEDYFFENKGDVVMHEPGDMRPPAFSGSVGTQIRPYDYNYNEGGIAGLPGGQRTPSIGESDGETFDIKTLGLDPGIMSIDDLEALFEEAGLDKSLIYKFINSGGLSQLLS